eukprot:987382-Rhodomonas_salina.1
MIQGEEEENVSAPPNTNINLPAISGGEEGEGAKSQSSSRPPSGRPGSEPYLTVPPFRHVRY